MIFFRSSNGRLAVPAKTLPQAVALIRSSLNSDRFEVAAGQGVVTIGEFEGERLVRMTELAEAATVDFIPSVDWLVNLQALLAPRLALVG